VPARTGSKPLAVRFVSDRASPGPGGGHHPPQHPHGPHPPHGGARGAGAASADSWRGGIPRPELSASDDSSVHFLFQEFEG